MKKNQGSQLPLFTGLENPWTPDREIIDLRIMLLDSLARQWYGEIQRLDDAQCPVCAEALYFHWNYLDPQTAAIAYCRRCGWYSEVNISV